MKAIVALTLLAAGPEFPVDAGYSPAPGDTARLHATCWDGRPMDVVLGRDEAAYARHLERVFRGGEAALSAAGGDTDLVVLPYGTEVVVERVVRPAVSTGRRVVNRRLLAVRPVEGSAHAPALLVLDVHVRRPLSESAARALVERYEASARDRRRAEMAREAARRDDLRRSRDEFQAQQLAHLRWFRDTTRSVTCTPNRRLVIYVSPIVAGNDLEHPADERRYSPPLPPR
jgi:hypothetical protein